MVLEVLEGEKTINEIASQYEIIPKNLQNWKKQFLENMSLAFDKSAVVKEYKEELESFKKNKIRVIRKFVKKRLLGLLVLGDDLKRMIRLIPLIISNYDVIREERYLSNQKELLKLGS